MIKIFIPSSIPFKELSSVIRAVEAAGYDKNQAFVGANFNEFAAQFRRGDTAVVYSLKAFSSVTEILSVVERLEQQGVELHSMAEPWFQDPRTTTKQMLVELFRLAEQIHQPLVRAPHRATRSKKQVLDISARVALAYELRTTQGLSIAQACRTAGCSVSAYYNHKRK